MQKNNNIVDTPPQLGNIPFVELYFSNKNVTGGEAIAIPLMDYPITPPSPDVEGATALSATSPTNRLYLVSMTHTIKNVATSSGHSLTLQILDPSWDFLTNITTSNFSGMKGFSVRYGWRGIDDKRAFSPVRVPFFLNDITVQLIPMKGALVTIHGVDESYKLDGKQVSYGFAPTTTVSEAIRAILMDEGFDPIIPDIRTPVGEFNFSPNVTPAKYIDQLLEIGLGIAGKAGYVRYTRLGSIMGQPQYVIEARNPRKLRVTKNYVFGREIQGSMLSFTPIFNHKLLMTNGGGKVTAIVVDPETKLFRKATTTQGDDDAEGDKRSDVTPKEAVVVVESPFDMTKTQAVISTLRQNADSLQWEGDATIVGDTELLPTDCVAIMVLKGGAPYEGTQFLSPNDIYSFATGVWRIVSVTHTISESVGFQTSLRMARYGGFVGKGESGYNAMPFEFTSKVQKVDASNLTEVTPLVNPGAGEAKSVLSNLSSVLNFIKSFV